MEPLKVFREIVDSYDADQNYSIVQRDDTVAVDINYPRYTDDDSTGNMVRHVEVGLCSVRAADSIRIHYDFDRDGWVVEQASIFSWSYFDPNQDDDWQEVAFIQAWARARPEDLT